MRPRSSCPPGTCSNWVQRAGDEEKRKRIVNQSVPSLVTPYTDSLPCSLAQLTAWNGPGSPARSLILSKARCPSEEPSGRIACHNPPSAVVTQRCNPSVILTLATAVNGPGSAALVAVIACQEFREAKGFCVGSVRPLNHKVPLLMTAKRPEASICFTCFLWIYP